MTNKLSPEELELWQKATAICTSLVDTSYAVARKKVSGMELEPSLEEKVINLLNKQAVDTEVFDTISGQHLSLDDEKDKPLIGTFIDEYRVKKFIAQGGMSSVYTAEYNKEGFKKDVAIKFLSPYCTSQKTIELFNREQQILSQLNHPNIVSFHHSGQTKDGVH